MPNKRKPKFWRIPGGWRITFNGLVDLDSPDRSPVNQDEVDKAFNWLLDNVFARGCLNKRYTSVDLAKIVGVGHGAMITAAIETYYVRRIGQTNAAWFNISYPIPKDIRDSVLSKRKALGLRR